MTSWCHDVMIKASQCHLTVTGDITSLWSVVSVWGESPRLASWEWRLSTRFILTNHVTPPENLNNVAKVLMEADYYTPLFFLFYVFVLSYSTVKCCFYIWHSYAWTWTPQRSDPGGVGGLHHTCEMTWFPWRQEKWSVVLLFLSVVLQTTLGNRRSVHRSALCRLWIMNAAPRCRQYEQLAARSAARFLFFVQVKLAEIKNVNPWETLEM